MKVFEIVLRLNQLDKIILDAQKQILSAQEEHDRLISKLQKKRSRKSLSNLKYISKVNGIEIVDGKVNVPKNLSSKQKRILSQLKTKGHELTNVGPV